MMTLETSRPRSALAPRFCREPDFQRFLGVSDTGEAQEEVKRRAEVEQLADIIYCDKALRRFDDRVLLPYQEFLYRRRLGFELRREE
jgi:hypothetical protein